jgi:hypothetical protein
MPVKLKGGVAGSAAFTVKDVLAVAPLLSFTVTVTEELPGAVGVPEMLPVLLEMLRPAGKPDAENLYGGAPPVALKPRLKLPPTVAAGTVPAKVMLSGAALTVTVKVVLAVAPALSFTVTVTLELPGAVGVPVMLPVPLEMLRPAGKPDAEKL